MKTIIRKYNKSDIPVLKKIWLQVFNDQQDYIDTFFTFLPHLGYFVVAQVDDAIVSMACVINNISISGHSCSYIYAVATETEYRHKGLASKILNTISIYSKQNDCKYICTLPENESLIDLYKKNLYTDNTMYCRQYSILKDDNIYDEIRLVSISAETYNNLREQYLSEIIHASFSNEYVEIQKNLCINNGGNIYQVGNGIATCYLENNILIIKELLCCEKETNRYVQSLLTYMDACSAVINSIGNTNKTALINTSEFDNGLIWWGLFLD